MNKNIYLEFIIFDSLQEVDDALRARLLDPNLGVIIIKHFLTLELKKYRGWNLWKNGSGLVIASAQVNEEGKRRLIRLCANCEVYMEDVHCLYFTPNLNTTPEDRIEIGSIIRDALQAVVDSLHYKNIS